ncbi:MAG: hypothetical protein IKG22_00295 [Atopobiaceae bacterium]|nr:hypothetical protein [Atopobiaceae bacterium]
MRDAVPARIDLSIEGSTLFGLDLSTLHSESIDLSGLKQWVHTLANSLHYIDDGMEESPEVTFHDAFLFELQAYCLCVAAADEAVSPEVVEGVNSLIGAYDLDLHSAADALEDISTSGWMLRYPASFQTLVWYAAGDDKDILSAGEIYFFYRQVARYVYSIEHTDSFDEKSNARGYVDALRKYVERVSVIGFEPPSEGQSSIAAVCEEWNRLMKGEYDELVKMVCGTWIPVSGDALPFNTLSTIMLSDDMRGSMGMWLVNWSIVEMPGGGQLIPLISIPEKDIRILMLPLSSGQMVGTVYAANSPMHLKTAVFQSDKLGNKSQSSAPAGSTGRSVPENRRTASTSKSSSSPKKGRLWKAIAVIVAVLVAVLIYTSMSPANKYERAMDYYNLGEYQKAADVFENLGDYEDSEAMMQKALLGVAAKQAETDAGEDPNAWKAAAKAYEKLGDSHGQYEAQTCRDYAAYYKGKKKMAKKRWKGAKSSFKAITDNHFKDVEELIDVCDTHIAYAAAKELFAAGDYYEAYAKFNALKEDSAVDLPDLSERAQACIQESPNTGPTYTNPGYASSSVPLTIHNLGGDSFYKIYDGDILVMSLFIQPGDTSTVSLPVGTYRMNEAHGEHWFGDKGMFGDKGQYYRCVFGAEDTFTLDWGYSYEISVSDIRDLRGTGIQTESIDKDTF